MIFLVQVKLAGKQGRTQVQGFGAETPPGLENQFKILTNPL